MTPEGFKKHKDLIEAWADGAEIEEYKYFAGWTPMQEGEPAWSETITYRIKPTTKTIQVWVNVYPYAGVAAYFSRGCADNAARTNRIACVPVTVTYTEGEGL